MSSIDQVIARSRQSGAFTERKRFTVARSRAIQKMRQFALADPYYYVTELIQSAISNGATYVDVAVESKFVAISYVGGGYAEGDLGQLFDFLFAAKSDVSKSDLRQLALGINAIMLMEPEEITVVSGDGTLEGTTQITIRGGEDVVDVGRPKEPLRGTFIRVAGLKRSKVKAKTRYHQSGELSVVQDRCILAPVPILFNDDPLFGYASVRTPNLFGYQRVVSFDEGDLYGSLGYGTNVSNRHLKLLTFGVWLQTFDPKLIPFEGIGGVVCFDGLNKTADHAAVVRDSRLDEMYARLRPYVQQLRENRRVRASTSISTLGGENLDVRALRELLRERGRAVLANESANPQERQRAARIAQLLEAVVVLAASDDMDTVRFIGGDDVTIYEPVLDTAADLRFYEQPPIPPPARPWLAGAQPIPSLSICEAVQRIHQEESSLDDPSGWRAQVKRWAEALGGRWIDHSEDEVASGDPLRSYQAGEEDERARLRLDETTSILGTIDATAYTPADVVTGAEEILVRVVSSDRLLWAGRVPSSYPGHVLSIELEDVVPRQLDLELSSGPRPLELAQALAHVMSRHAAEQMQEASRRALGSLAGREVSPKTTTSRVVLAALARGALLRLRGAETPDEERVHASMLDAYEIDLFDLPILKARSGRSYSGHQLVSLMASCGGLVYGTVPEIEPDLYGLDLDRVLDLDLQEERMVVSLLGRDAYVRVDGRDVLATHANPEAYVRDVAIGLRPPSGERLFLEHTDHESWIDGTRRAVESRLVSKLITLWRGRTRAVEPDDENRRQAGRHLLHYACATLEEGGDAEDLYGVLDELLVLDARGTPRSLRELLGLWSPERPLVMHDGRARGPRDARPEWLPTLDDPGSAARRPDFDGTLAFNPFALGQLSRLGRVDAAFASSSDDARDPASYLVSLELDADGVSGVLGVPLDEPATHRVALVDSIGATTESLYAEAERYGVTGLLRLRVAGAARPMISTHGGALLRQCMDLVSTEAQGSDRWARAARALFRYASLHTTLTAQPMGDVALDARDVLTQRILSLPIFDTNDHHPVSARRLAQEFCAYVDLEDPHSSWRAVCTPLASSVHPDLVSWLDENLRVDAIHRLADHPRPADVEQPPSGALEQRQRVEERLRAWLEHLRPDDVPGGVLRLVRAAGQPATDDPWERHFRNRAEPTSPFLYSSQSSEVFLINLDHSLIARCVERIDVDPSALAWLLLASYAYINEVLEPVTNEHELIFQRRVAESLRSGALTAQAPQR